MDRAHRAHRGRRVAVLLAGGRGARLHAGVPKALVTLAGRSFLDRALETLTALADDLRVVVPAGMELTLPAQVARVADPPGDTGPLGALVAGLLAAPFEREAVVLAVDLPGVRPEALCELAERRGQAAAVIASVAGIPQPLAGWYTLTAAARLAESWGQGERSLTRSALSAGALVVPVETLAGPPALWLNVNTPQDLALSSEQLA